MNKFTAAAKAKGWQMQDIASRWGVTPRQMSRIAGKPDQRDWDALAGIPLHRSPEKQIMVGQAATRKADVLIRGTRLSPV